MDSVYSFVYRAEHETNVSMFRATSFPPSLFVTANPAVRWLPYLFMNTEVMLWVTDGRDLLRLYRHSLSTSAYAVFLKKRPGNQVQLAPKIFVSFAQVHPNDNEVQYYQYHRSSSLAPPSCRCLRAADTHCEESWEGAINAEAAGEQFHGSVGGQVEAHQRVENEWQC